MILPIAFSGNQEIWFMSCLRMKKKGCFSSESVLMN